MPPFTIQQCAIPAVTFLICIIAYPSHWLLRQLGPQPLTGQQSVILHVYALILVEYQKTGYQSRARYSKAVVLKTNDNGRDGVANVRLINRHELITARHVKGLSFLHI
ncbi:hypothetical protein D6D21_06611 [Aureobasidium pullulans]|uniref:Uncharacterized protein n=1 Tax=Aureobasidium pullulans TaxID=5580 RepID=A0AB74IT90_AURPU|nr:hypothetical protein D6D21_06611 [Aureobasidium pullulans]